MTSANDTQIIHVAMIFDDGPSPAKADSLMQIFEEEDIKVTFGSLAKNVKKHPDTAKALLAAGHEIANHSYDHKHPKDVDDAGLEHEIVGAQDTIESVTGFAPKWYWPPYLAKNKRVYAMAQKAGIQVYKPKHLIDTKDWDKKVDADKIREKATTNIKDGSVILFHEWRSATIEQMPAIIADLKEQGCVFMTFTEMDAYVNSQK